MYITLQKHVLRCRGEADSVLWRMFFCWFSKKLSSPPTSNPHIIEPPTPSNDPPETHTYVGIATSFKDRFRNHTKSFNHRKYSKETKLSKKIWQLKDEGIDYEIKWKILSRAQPFSPITGVCGLCTQEKWYILFRPDLASLNKREEIAGHCFHKAPALLKNS